MQNPLGEPGRLEPLHQLRVVADEVDVQLMAEQEFDPPGAASLVGKLGCGLGRAWIRICVEKRIALDVTETVGGYWCILRRPR